MTRKPKPTLLGCGHFSDGQIDGAPSCSICTDREIHERFRARTVEAPTTDPTTAPPASGPGGATAATTGETDLPPFEAGIRRMFDGDYHADPLRQYGTMSLSGTSTRLLLPPYTPAHFYHKMTTPRTPPTAAQILGGAVHAVALGTAPLDVFDGKSWQSAAARGFLAEHNPDYGHAPVLVQDVETVEQMAHQLRTHPIARMLLEGAGEGEAAMFAQYPDLGVWLRGKTDKLAMLAGSHLVIGDIKTTASFADAIEFRRAVGKYGYAQQAAHYRRIARILGLAKKVTVILVIVESFAPYLVNVVEIVADDMDLADHANEVAYRRFAHCLKTGQWPGYPETIHPLSLTPWDAQALEAAIETEHLEEQ